LLIEWFCSFANKNIFFWLASNFSKEITYNLALNFTFSFTKSCLKCLLQCFLLCCNCWLILLDKSFFLLLKKITPIHSRTLVQSNNYTIRYCWELTTCYIALIHTDAFKCFACQFKQVAH
jgi:hypothetical protein